MKNLLGLLRSVFTGISTHKLRSFLTMLGIVIGVGAVIILMSVGKGTTAQIVSNLSTLGTNLVYVQPGSSSSGGVRMGFGSATTLTLEDAEAIAENIANITAVAPYSNSTSQVIAGSENMRSQIIGVTADYQQAYELVVIDGDFINQSQYDRKSKVAVIGPTVATTLFGEDYADTIGSPVGKKIRMSNTVFTIIGVLESKGSSMMSSTDQAILIPLSTLQTIMSRAVTTTGQHTVNSITLLVTDKEMLSTVKEDVTLLLQERHNIAVDASNDFTISTMDDLISTISASSESLTLLLGAIAGISLLVGGIGVMNIMLVSVLERTREIGIRKALGARESDIWAQFLIEAAVLTFTGGIIGVVIGWGGSYLINYMEWMTTTVTADIVILAVSVSVGIGIFFGFYPAWNASRLDPIQALRSE
jgi:putative ABC transport system permease protein